jgi:hypothetical protein
MKERVDPERSHDFKRTFLLAASLALFLALLFLGFYYGCAKSSRPERPTNSPPASGMSAALRSDLKSISQRTHKPALQLRDHSACTPQPPHSTTSLLEHS